MSDTTIRNNCGLIMYHIRESCGRTEVRTPLNNLAGYVRDGRSYDGRGTLINGRNGNIAEIIAQLNLSDANVARGF